MLTILDESESVLHHMGVAEIYRKIIFVANIILIPLLIYIGSIGNTPLIILLLISLLFIWVYLSLIFTEYLISDKRIIIKKGVVTRTVKEINLSSVETVTVNQGVIDRIFKTGGIAISGRGSEIINIMNIDEPFNVRKKIENNL